MSAGRRAGDTEAVCTLQSAIQAYRYSMELRGKRAGEVKVSRQKSLKGAVHHSGSPMSKKLKRFSITFSRKELRQTQSASAVSEQRHSVIPDPYKKTDHYDVVASFRELRAFCSHAPKAKVFTASLTVDGNAALRDPCASLGWMEWLFFMLEEITNDMEAPVSNDTQLLIEEPLMPLRRSQRRNSSSPSLLDEQQALEDLQLSPVQQRDSVIQKSSAFIALDSILAIPNLKQKLREYLESQVCVENLLFLDAIRDYKTCTHVNQRRWKALEVYNVFYSENGKFPLNLSYLLVDQVRETMFVKSSYPIDLFDESYGKIHQLLERDVFRRFLQSDMFETSIESATQSMMRQKASFKRRGWVNRERYQSIRIHVKEAFGILSKKDILCMLTVDSLTRKTKAKANSRTVVWNENMQFPLQSTTRFFELNICSARSMKHLGRVHIPLEMIEEPFQDVWYRLLPSKETQSVPKGEIKLRIELLREKLRTSLVKRPSITSRLGSVISTLSPIPIGQGHIGGLDLDYITAHIVAMACPIRTVGVNSLLNRSSDADELAEFLQAHHAGCFKVINLCFPGEAKPYDLIEAFQSNVFSFPIKPDSPPAFDTLVSIVNFATEWLERHPQHIVAFHSKGNCTREATVIACLLLKLDKSQSRADAIDAFWKSRLARKRKPLSPNQNRFVDYYAAYLKQVKSLSTQAVFIRSFRLKRVPKAVARKLHSIKFVINGAVDLVAYTDFQSETKDQTSKSSIECILNETVRIAGTVQVEIFSVGKHKGKEALLLSVWFDTRFQEDAELTCSEMDVDVGIELNLFGPGTLFHIDFISTSSDIVYTPEMLPIQQLQFSSRRPSASTLSLFGGKKHHHRIPFDSEAFADRKRSSKGSIYVPTQGRSD